MYEPDRIRVELMEDYTVDSGNAVCDYCGCKFKEHQPVPGYRWLVKLCNGDLVKLTSKT